MKNEYHRGKIIVANSADLGYLKSTPEFWQIIRKSLTFEVLSQILVVDDFGFNESSQDSYTDAEKITTRQCTTAHVLSDVFGCRVQTFPFLLQNKNFAELETLMSEFQDIIKKAGTFIKEVMG